MSKINVLVMGNSGAGKSTLINAVFRFDRAVTGDGPSITKEMAIYENDSVPFRAIDTRGLEYGLLEQLKTQNAIKKWSRDSVKGKDTERYIHLIWYCLDATSKRIFQKNLATLKTVSRLWKGIPIIIVLTKSYSRQEIPGNETMVRQALEQYKKQNLNVRDVVSVVARPFPIDESLIVPPMGLERLIEVTNAAAPEALRLNQGAVEEFEMRLKRNNANALTAAATASAALIGAVPIPIADSALLIPLQSGLVIGIGKLYQIQNEEHSLKQISQVIIQSGVVSVGAKTVLSTLKAIPGLNIAASLLNAAVAGVITAVVGEVTVLIMEKIARGELHPDDLDWIQKFADSQFTSQLAKYLNAFGPDFKAVDAKSIASFVVGLFRKSNR